MTNEWTSFRVAGYEIKVLEVGDSVSVFDSGMSPIRVKDSEAAFYPYEARRVAELLMRPDARELAEQLLRAAEIADGSRFAECRCGCGVTMDSPYACEHGYAHSTGCATCVTEACETARKTRQGE